MVRMGLIDVLYSADNSRFKVSVTTNHLRTSGEMLIV